MNKILERRRALMAQKSGGGIPSGYVTDGLVFFLDGLQADANSWTDIVGGKTFELTDCVVAGNGVIFNGSSSIGLCDGPITRNWVNETIEVAITGSSSSGSRSIFGQPFVDGAVGISMLISSAAQGRRVAMFGINGIEDDYGWFSANAKLISACPGLCVADMLLVNDRQHATPSKNESGKATLGHRIIGQSVTSYFAGTIYAVRIYNRKLTEAEMLQNQQADLERYGITI